MGWSSVVRLARFVSHKRRARSIEMIIAPKIARIMILFARVLTHPCSSVVVGWVIDWIGRYAFIFASSTYNQFFMEFGWKHLYVVGWMRILLFSRTTPCRTGRSSRSSLCSRNDEMN